MKAFLLAAGRGVRFRPVTEAIPKPLFPYLNVPLVLQHLRRLPREEIAEAGINLHHLGGEVERRLSDLPPELPHLFFFREPHILGTAGALANAAGWLADDDFLLVNTDAAIEPAFRGLIRAHRRTGRAATLLVVENRQPDRYTPLQSEGDRIVGFGKDGGRPLLYTGVCVMSSRIVSRIPPGERSLVADLWEPLLAEGLETIGFVMHDGPFADLGVPGDFLSASLEALARGGPFLQGSGDWDPERRVLAITRPREADVELSVVGEATIGRGARVRNSVLWSGCRIGAGSEIDECLVAAGRVADGARHRGVLLWPGADGLAREHPLGRDYGVHRLSPRR